MLSVSLALQYSELGDEKKDRKLLITSTLLLLRE